VTRAPRILTAMAADDLVEGSLHTDVRHDVARDQVPTRYIELLKFLLGLRVHHSDHL